MYTVTFENGQFFDVSAESPNEAREIALWAMPHAGNPTHIAVN